MRKLKKEKIKIIQKNLVLKEKDPKVKIKINKSGELKSLLNLSQDEKVSDQPMSQFDQLVTSGKIDQGELIKKLNQIKVFNKNKNPDLQKKFDKIIQHLHKKFIES